MGSCEFGQFLNVGFLEFVEKYNALIDKIALAQKSIPSVSFTIYPNGPYSDPSDPRYLQLDGTGNHNSPEEIVTFNEPYYFRGWRYSDGLPEKIWPDSLKFGHLKGNGDFVNPPEEYDAIIEQTGIEFIKLALSLITNELCPHFYNQDKAFLNLTETEWTSYYSYLYDSAGNSIYDGHNFVGENFCWNWESLCEKHGIPLRVDWDKPYYPDYFPFNWPKNYHVLLNKLIDMLDEFQYVLLIPWQPFVNMSRSYGKYFKGSFRQDILDIDNNHWNHKVYVTYNDDFWEVTIGRSNSGKVSPSIITGPFTYNMPSETSARYFAEEYKYCDSIATEVYQKPFSKKYLRSVQQTNSFERFHFVNDESGSGFNTTYGIDRNIEIERESVYNFSGRSYSGVFGIKTITRDDGVQNEKFEYKNFTIPASGEIDFFPEPFVSARPPLDIHPIYSADYNYWDVAIEGTGNNLCNKYYYYASKVDPNSMNYCIGIQKI